MKKLLTVLIVIVGIYLLACVLVPKEYNVSRTTSIDAPSYVVYSQVANLENWEKWSPWEEKDSTIDNTFSGAEMGIGQIMSWTSEESGTGRLEIIEAEENKMMRTTVDFEGQGRGYGSWSFDEEEGKTKTTWGMKGETPFIMRPFNLLMDGMLGADFEAGLANLKEVAESMPIEPKVEVKMELMPAIQYLSVKDSCASIGDSVSAKLGELYGLIGDHLKAQGVEMAGMPFALYYSWDSVSTVFEAAIPVAEEVESGDRVIYHTFPATEALVAYKVGGYDTEAEHMAIEAKMQESGLQPMGPAFEFYTNDPMEVGMENATTTVAYPINEVMENEGEE